MHLLAFSKLIQNILTLLTVRFALSTVSAGTAILADDMQEYYFIAADSNTGANRL